MLNRYGKWETLVSYLKCCFPCFQCLINPKMFHGDELQVIKYTKKRYKSILDKSDDEDEKSGDDEDKKKKKIKEDTGLVQYKIRVQRADEPSNILWKSND